MNNNSLGTGQFICADRTIETRKGLAYQTGFFLPIGFQKLLWAEIAENGIFITGHLKFMSEE